MKKFVSLVLAVALVLTSVASMAFIVPAASESTKQVQLIAVMPVDVQTTNPGVKSYTEIVDTTKIYQANDLITIATIIEMKNLAKNTLLTSVEGKRIDIRLSSTTVDLSYGMLAPSFVYNIYGANSWGASTIASNTLAIAGSTVASGKSAISYDPATGTVTLRVKAVGNGTDLDYDIGSDLAEDKQVSGNFINQGCEQNGVWIAGAIQAYAPFNGYTRKAWGQGDPCVWIPAINSKNTNDFVAPTAVQYALIMTGITKPATTGDMKAEMLVSSKEEFEKVGEGIDMLYPINRTKSTTARPIETVAEANKLEIGKTYTVFRLFEKMANNKDRAVNRENVTDFLMNNYNYTFTTSRNDLRYREDAGTMEVFQIYKYDGDKDYHAGDFIANLVTEATKNPVQSAKGLWVADAKFEKLAFNENKYYYTFSLVGDARKDRAASPAVQKLFNTELAALIKAANDLSTPVDNKNNVVAAADADFQTKGTIVTGADGKVRVKFKNTIPTGLYGAATPIVALTSTATVGATTKYVEVAKFTGSTVVTPTDVIAVPVAAAVKAVVTANINEAEFNKALTATNDKPYLNPNDNTYYRTPNEAVASLNAIFIELPAVTGGGLYDDDMNGNKSAASGKGSGDIKDALAFFQIPLGINNTNKIVEDTFTAVAASAVWSEAVTNTYSYGTITIIEDVVDEGTEEEVIEEVVEEVVEEIVDEEEFVEEEVEEVVVPATGDFSANVALALIASAIVAACALVFVTRKAR